MLSLHVRVPLLYHCFPYVVDKRTVQMVHVMIPIHKLYKCFFLASKCFYSRHIYNIIKKSKIKCSTPHKNYIQGYLAANFLPYFCTLLAPQNNTTSDSVFNGSCFSKQGRIFGNICRMPPQPPPPNPPYVGTAHNIKYNICFI